MKRLMALLLALIVAVALVIVVKKVNDDDDETAPAAAPVVATEDRGEAPPPVTSHLRAGAADKPLRTPGEIIVSYKPTIAPEARADARGFASTRLLEDLPGPQLELVKVEAGQSLADAVSALESDPAVEYAVPNYIRTADAIPSDARFTELWGLNNTGQIVDGVAATPDVDIDAVEAWDVTTGSRNVKVAVLDTGVAYDHPDLAANMWTNPGESGGGKESNGVDDDGNGYVDDFRGWDFAHNDNDPRDYDGHGTHVAGTIGANGNDGIGVTGVNWAVTIMPVRVIGPKGGSDADIIKAFAYAAKMGADVVNGSFGGPGFSQAFVDELTKAPDTLFVFSAGNDAIDNETDNNRNFPCSYNLPNTICVAAVDPNDNLADFSNWGATKVHLAAPGTSVLSSAPHADLISGEDFETDVARWVPGDAASTWGRGEDSYGHFITESPNGNYPDNANTWLRNAEALDLTGKAGCSMKYWLGLHVQPGDWLFVETSPDGNSWTEVDRWTGDTGSSIPHSETDLSTLDGSSRAFVRFRVQTDATGNADGTYIDDVEISCVTATYGGTEYQFLQGTSMATPHVAGAAALLLSVAPDASVQKLRDVLLQTVDPVPALQGRVSTGGRLNVHKAVLAVTAQG